MIMSEEKEIVKISVRNLVEFIFREGDITSGGGLQNTEAMQLGSRIHRKIQKKMSIGYMAEVPLSCHYTFQSREFGNDFVLMTEGRADGIFSDNDLVYIDEIKGMFLDVTTLKKPFSIHRAQAMCYAYMKASLDNLPKIGIQLTYCNLETEQIQRFQECFTRPEIDAWFSSLMDSYEKWVVYEYDWKKKKEASIKKLHFPFPYRTGQKELAAMTYHTIKEKKKLFLEAPTGVGKTITTVFPAIKAVGEGLCDRVFYLTAKTITRTVAEDCFSLLQKQDLCFKSLTITAKEKMCILDKPSCNPADCERARGHFDRVNDAVYNMLTQEKHLTREVILRYASLHNVCPFEMCLDAALFADAVICDYNYAFDPNVYLRRFFTNETKGNMVLLVDEAHNLVERGREMYSASLIKEDFLTIRRLVNALEKIEKRPEVLYNLRNFKKALETANQCMLKWKRQCDEFETLTDTGMFPLHLLRILSSYERFVKDYPVLPERETMLSFYFQVKKFCTVCDWLDDKYQIYTNYDSDGQFRIKLQCMDPSVRLKEVLERGRSAVFFSATLLPVRYYKEQLSGTAEDPAVYASSSFSSAQQKILIANDVTSRYTRRTKEEYQKIARYIETFCRAKKGNYLVFFPSYSFMHEIKELVRFSDSVRLLLQSPDMSEAEKEAFLNAFETGKDRRAVIGFCVMGGIFSEGIDLTCDRLIGAVIVGTGLPMVCHERELFKKYYDEKKGQGFNYAYLYPGINKVFQAGGRVIRTAEDKGAILLLDERFLKPEYRNLFPREWFPFETVTCEKIKDTLADFWNTND